MFESRFGRKGQYLTAVESGEDAIVAAASPRFGELTKEIEGQMGGQDGRQKI